MGKSRVKDAEKKATAVEEKLVPPGKKGQFKKVADKQHSNIAKAAEGKKK